MSQDGAPPKVGALLEKVMERLELRGSEEAKPVPLPWPMAEFVYGGGLYPGVHLLFGRVGSGRTQLAAQVAKHAAGLRTPTLYLSLEQDAATQVVSRWLALEAGLAWSDVYLGKLEKDDWVKVAAAEASLDELPLHLMAVSAEQWAAPMLERAMAGMRSAYGGTAATSLIVVDGVQALRDGEGVEAWDRVVRTVRDAADLALRFNAAVFVLLSQSHATEQLPEDDEGFGEGDPARLVSSQLDDLDPAATSVAILGRPGWSGEEAHLGVARQRFGRGGWVELVFDGTEFGGGFG
jgi:replicative DNA helicase